MGIPLREFLWICGQDEGDCMFRPESEQTETTLYHVGLVACAVFAVGALVVKIGGMPEGIWAFFFACPLYTATGYYCFGCGGTRAFTALLQGRLWRSFLYHPAVCLGTIYFVAFMASRVLYRLTKGRCPRVRFRRVYLYLLIGLVLVNFFVKNWLHYRLGIDILGVV